MENRKVFTMTQEDYDEIIKACQPVPMIMLQCGRASSAQENTNRAWRDLGRRMGFDGMTVRPYQNNPLEFWAVPLTKGAME